MEPQKRPFTPETLAARWDCSAETVRQMVHRGDLSAFFVGRMIRIPHHYVEAYECQRSQSAGSAEVSAFTGKNKESAAVINLKHAVPRKRKLKP
ncbi:helix-turn-helix domain-containing protein [Sulfitobacter brevis]|uniref:helix-turn-helix domain-containing protein n=1 Tax=Sulfitobacter brevis TaxID=74348 RepID=UPI0011609B85